jgi:cyclophilin family peptidyl-prolyl cis-trans isomerase
MASGRSTKRARKKERRNARREEWQAFVKRRRRQRYGVLLGSLAVIGVGVLIAFLAFKPASEKPRKSPRRSPSSSLVTVPVKRPVACDAKLPVTAGSKKKQFSKPADEHLSSDKTYIWRLETSCGNVDIELDTERSPKTANSIAFLTRQGFYDGLFFHRLVQNFVIQGGDPMGTGGGGSGYQVVEAPPSDIEYKTGVVAMAKAQNDPPGASGSQFFIVTDDHTAQTLSSPDYALVGKVVDGQDVVDRIESQGHLADNIPPKAWVYIEHATIVEQ